MRVAVVLLGMSLLFVGTVELRLGSASCEMIADHSQRGSCLARQIEIDTALKPPVDRVKEYKAASDNLPDDYSLALRLAQAYVASGDPQDALPVFDRAESLARPHQPQLADRIVEERKAASRAIDPSR